MSAVDPARALLDMERRRVAELLAERDCYIAEIARLRTLVKAAERHWQAHLRGEG